MNSRQVKQLMFLLLFACTFLCLRAQSKDELRQEISRLKSDSLNNADLISEFVIQTKKMASDILYFKSNQDSIIKYNNFLKNIISNLNDSIIFLMNRISIQSDSLKFYPDCLPKRSIMNDLVGNYRLSLVDRYEGANTWTQWNSESGYWNRFSTGLMPDGQRGVLDESLESQSNCDLLNSMSLIVNNDLSLFVSVLGRHFFEVPFDECGMLYQLDPNTEDVEYSVLPDYLNPKCTIRDTKLHLLATQETSGFTDMLGELGLLPNVAHLFYSIEETRFKLILSDSGATYTFEF